MKVNYDAKTDTLTVVFRDVPVAESDEDKPGVIAEIATALGSHDININDIEIMKVREGEGGPIRLGLFVQALAAKKPADLAIKHWAEYE